MPLHKCPKCRRRKAIADETTTCPNCGWVVVREVWNKQTQVSIPIGVPNRKTERGMLIFFGVLFLGFIVWAANTDNSPTTTTIKNPAYDTNNTVYNSNWDGSVSQVKDWLKDNLRDPESLKFNSWGEVTAVSPDVVTVWVEYRAKNGFGGYNVETKQFRLDRHSGAILSVN